ncbi:MAG TPA: hypothetical protein VN370_12215 [Desulfitobacteriaceae bacterium]|jgi:hypothetical protein|nr:hypothetical protein [Desulfitobacteriaceae bacterium]
MEEKKCACKSSNPMVSSTFMGGLLVYELAVVIIILLFIHIDLDELKETLKHKSLNKDSSPAE